MRLATQSHPGFDETEWPLSHTLMRLLPVYHYRTTPQATTGVSPSALVFGRNLRTRLDLLWPEVGVRVSERQALLSARPWLPGMRCCTLVTTSLCGAMHIAGVAVWQGWGLI